MSRKFYLGSVCARRPVSAGMVRVTFGGEGMSDFVSTGIGDEYLRLFFPGPATGEMVLPEIDENGNWSYPDGATPSHTAPYTVRNFDGAAGTLDIDFVIHEGGIASDWARRSEPGEILVLSEPRGLYTPPAETRWQLLVADATGLPAVSRILEQTPGHIQSRVIVELPEKSHRQALPDNGRSVVTWHEGSGNGVGPSVLPGIVRATPLPADPFYIWVAAEQRTVRPIRRFLRHELGLAPERYKVVAYWTDRLNEWREGWNTLDTSVRAKIDAAWASERDPEEVRDEVEATLERHGL